MPPREKEAPSREAGQKDPDDIKNLSCRERRREKQSVFVGDEQSPHVDPQCPALTWPALFLEGAAACVESRK
jgi:hypothetical protein